MKRLALYLTVFTFLYLFNETAGHLKLTFPPARPYAFDFLDNVNTGEPCGVDFDDGNQIMTTLVADEAFNVTWHISYPHLGGVKFQLLDADGEVKHELSDSEFLFSDDSTAMTHQITIGADHVCDHCILKLTKEANEWRDEMDGAKTGDEFWMGYVFWSCADVTIVGSDTVADGCYDGKCLNGGTCDAGTCTCAEKFEGERCEFENHCSTDEDCSSQGACVNIEATSYPKQVCFCDAGWMGRHCETASPLEEAVLTEDEESEYFKIVLYEEPHLFEILWKIVGDDENEIEFVVRSKTDTWSAVGWRPVELDERCKDFPVKLTPPPADDAAGNDTATDDADSATNDTETAEEEAARRKRRDLPNCRVRRRTSSADFKTYLNRTRREAEEEVEVNMIEKLCNEDGFEESTDWAKWAFIYDDDGSRKGAKLPAYEDEDDSDLKEQYFGEDSHDSFVQVLERYQLHHMDCSDIVFASEHEGRHRVVDMYTRDRSTPQADTWYNGTDDLTAAVATRVDGILHVRFRRNLTSADPTDHGFSDIPFRLNWARGQTPTQFWHMPMSGMEMCKTSDYGFYRVNEIKYHGTRITQRGTQLYNIYEDPEVIENDEEAVMHADMYRHPPECVGDDCVYRASWRCRKNDGRVFFKIEAKVEEGRWASIGFSEDQNVEGTDAAVGWVEPSNGELTLTDRWIEMGEGDNATDPIYALDNGPSSFEDATGSYADGVLTMEFSRKLDTEDLNDLKLTECVYFYYSWGGEVQDGDVTKHESSVFSEKKICVGSSSIRMGPSMLVFLICLLSLLQSALQNL